MFPTTHDILPGFLAQCTALLTNLLFAGNDVLIVSKPHLDCIRDLCGTLGRYRHQITFRFTIGSCDDVVLDYWEPGAPSFAERFESLQHAYRHGFPTSVSCEPLLDGGWRAVELLKDLRPWITDTIWFGKMNQPQARCTPDTDPQEIGRIERLQTPGAIHWLYEQLKDDPKVRWKESYKAVLGLPSAEKAGMEV